MEISVSVLKMGNRKLGSHFVEFLRMIKYVRKYSEGNQCLRYANIFLRYWKEISFTWLIFPWYIGPKFLPLNTFMKAGVIILLNEHVFFVLEVVMSNVLLAVCTNLFSSFVSCVCGRVVNSFAIRSLIV